MLGSVKNELPIELVNAVLLALFAVLPVLIVGFTWQSLLALRIRPVFSLLRFESDEMDRATILHQDVCRRLKQQRDMCERAAGLWGALFDRHKHSYEIEGLEAHAQYLRTTIMRLRHQPLLRIKNMAPHQKRAICVQRSACNLCNHRVPGRRVLYTQAISVGR
jgi:hypothetical protein